MPRLVAPTTPLVTPPPETAEARSPLWWLRWVPTAIAVVLLLDLLYVVGQVAIVPVLASLALAYVLNPLVERVERHLGVSRALAAGLALILVGAGLVLFAFIVIPSTLR